ncbi:YbhB/YbcL family Raf kinase inhibitor-like protein [Lactobacillus sp. CBA3606]|uniref:YbhB/YbcL family Raf kinase inhibitor-like protein n=1 Tax=Lactobacillus sp. CBA3606 TaxID=2099789 RepID=UPI000CFB9A40|nr:YbhB/YbcL family Raf kinase inhibitor-like protein [Lactobacillus sp. CBA3606]AVK64598.1 YbhB/YbcL family Raf kinase inhibitor-like protein [Lactobacillus sp. CBA3606]
MENNLIPTDPFQLTSDNLTSNQPVPFDQLGVEGAANLSPQLSWTGFKPETKSFALTMYDLDAPTGSGFWHWALYDIPATITNLSTDAGNPTQKNLPFGSKHLKNDARLPFYAGPAPFPGTGKHRYLIAVTALDIEKLKIDSEATPAMLNLTMMSHTVGRATLMVTAEIK